VLNAPEGYLERIGVARPGPDHTLDFLLLFVADVAELKRLGPAAVASVKPDGLLWVTYPKGGKTRGATDLPATPWWHKRDVLGEITGVAGLLPSPRSRSTTIGPRCGSSAGADSRSGGRAGADPVMTLAI
jgi:hypothetical protein